MEIDAIDKAKGHPEQKARWRSPMASAKWKGCAELVLSTLEYSNGNRVDIRVMTTKEHPKGETFTRHGFRITQDQAASLAKALMHILEEWGE